MSQPGSTGYTFNPKPNPQRSFASALLNYESKPYDFDSGTQTRKNDYQSNSRNQSLNDSEEITRRMDMLKRNLGLPVQKPEKNMSYSDDQAFSKYLGNPKDQQQSFLQGLGNSATKKDRDLSDYLNLDEDSVFQTDSKSQVRKGQSTSNMQRNMNSKEQDMSPYKLSASEDMSPYREQSFERELGNYANQGISFKVYKNEDKEAKSALLALQRENELLRKKLEEERTSQEAQNKILNAHLEEYRKTVAFDKESEELLKQNIVFYKGQIHDFEKQIMELRGQVNTHQHNEHSARRSILADQDQFRIREQSYINEIDALKKELQIMHQQDVLNAESFGSNDVYLRKLEMNIKFLNSQIKDLSQDKSHLQTINENLENEFRILSDKLYAEIEEKYKKEIDEKDFIIKSLKRDFELYMHMDGDSAQRASFRKTLKKKIVRPGSESERKRTKGPRDSEDEHDDPYLRLNQLENENFILKEKLDMMELQNKGPRNSAREGPNMYEAQITQRRVQTMKEALIYWKEKTEKLASTFHGALKQLRQENEGLKENLISQVGNLEGEIDGYVKKIKKYYKKEQVKILEMVSTLEEKHYQNQAKLADARSKYKNVTLAPSSGNISHNTTKRKTTKTRHDVVHFSP